MELLKNIRFFFKSTNKTGRIEVNVNANRDNSDLVDLKLLDIKALKYDIVIHSQVPKNVNVTNYTRFSE